MWPSKFISHNSACSRVSEIYRIINSNIWKCTYTTAIEFNKKSGNKNNLADLYKQLIKKEVDNGKTHRSIYDCELCAEIYFHFISLNLM